MRIAWLAIGRVATTVVVLGGFGGMTAVTHPVAMAFLALELVWSCAEGALARGDLGKTRQQRLEMRRTPLTGSALRFVLAGKRYALANFVYQAVVLAEFARRATVSARTLSVLTVAGLVVYALGATMRGWAMASLGERFQSWTVARSARGVSGDGAYALVRHPSYLGLLLIAVSLPLTFGQPWLLLLALVPAVAIASRIAPEEDLLRNAYGEAYEIYSSRTRSKLIPGIW